MSLTSSVEHEVRHPARTRSAITTPDWLRICSVVLAAALVVLAAVSVGVVVSHRRSVDAILHRSAPQVVAAQDLYVALAAADAAASSGLLQPGSETPELRAAYHERMTAAGEHLVTIAAEQGLSPSTRASVESIAGQLQEYAGLVELARANTLQEFPVGAAYLRHASDLMRDQILPAATDVYTDAANDLDQHYRDGTDRKPLAAMVVCAGLVLALLVGAQIFVALRSRRLFNPGLLVATLLVIVLAGTAVALVESQHRSLASSRSAGSDPLLYASTSRILLLRSRTAENLYLIERLTDSPHADDFDTVVAGLGGTDDGSGSLDGVAASATAAETATDRSIVETYARYLALHDEVRSIAKDVSFDSAAAVAVGAEARAAAQLDTALDRNVEAAQANLRSAAHAADDRLRPLMGISLLLPLAAASAAVVGIGRRAREYR